MIEFIVAAVAAEPTHVSELARRLGMSRALLYMHLQRLEEAGFLTGHFELSDDGKALKVFEVVPAGNSFEGAHTVRIYNLLAFGALYEQVPVHPGVLPLVEKVLDPGCLVSSLSSISILPEADRILESLTDLLPLWPPLVYTGLEIAAFAVCVAVAWRIRRSSPELGMVLALLPLFFAYRSLFSYFFLLPLFAFASLVRMPLGELDPALARASGAVTLFAFPARAVRGLQPDGLPAGAPAAAD